MTPSSSTSVRDVRTRVLMGRTVRNIVLAAVFALAAVRGVAGQTLAPSRGFLVVNGGYQVTANDFSDDAVRRDNAEDGRIDTKYVVKGGPSFDFAVGGILWRGLGVGVGLSRFSVSTRATLAGTVPHPFFFNQPRSVSGEAAGLKREEQAINVQVRGVFPVGTKLQVMVFGGPSFFQVKQGVVSGFTYTDSYPYDAATFKAATTTTSSASKMGFNGGGDIAFFFARQLGVGASVQFASTTVALPAAGGADRDVKVGGVKAGGGLRVRF